MWMHTADWSRVNVLGLLSSTFMSVVCVTYNVRRYMHTNKVPAFGSVQLLLLVNGLVIA